MDLMDHFGFGSGPAIERSLRENKSVSPEELAHFIETHPNEPLPDIVRDYLIRLLLGEVHRKPGPKPRDDALSQVVLHFAQMEYERALQEFQEIDARRKREARERGEKLPKGLPAPHERAIELVKRTFRRFRGISPERLRNILSEERSWAASRGK